MSKLWPKILLILLIAFVGAEKMTNFAEIFC